MNNEMINFIGIHMLNDEQLDGDEQQRQQE